MRAKKNTRKGLVGTAVKGAGTPPIAAYCKPNAVKSMKNSVALDGSHVTGYAKIKGAVSG